MLRRSLQYSYITNGKAFVSLYFLFDNSSTLHYHLSELTVEVAEDPQTPLCNTAVGQVLAFIPLALESHRGPQESHQTACRVPKLWSTDDDSIVYRMSAR